MTITKQMLSNLPTSELNVIVQMAREITEDRHDLRKRELWGNIVAAIRKYESEIGDIVVDDGDAQGTICADCLDDPGYLIIGF